MFVDSIIALISTNHPQIKYILQDAYEASLSQVTPNSLGLILDAITRTDMEYIRDEADGEDGESGDEGMDEEFAQGSDAEDEEEQGSEDAGSDDEASD